MKSLLPSGNDVKQHPATFLACFLFSKMDDFLHGVRAEPKSKRKRVKFNFLSQNLHYYPSVCNEQNERLETS